MTAVEDREIDVDSEEPTGPAVLENDLSPGAPDQDSNADATSGWVDQQSGWVIKKVPVHNCIKPPIDNQTFVGSVWRCGCGQHWEVYAARGRNVGQKKFKKIDRVKVEERLAAQR